MNNQKMSQFDQLQDEILKREGKKHKSRPVVNSKSVFKIQKIIKNKKFKNTSLEKHD